MLKLNFLKSSERKIPHDDKIRRVSQKTLPTKFKTILNTCPCDGGCVRCVDSSIQMKSISSLKNEYEDEADRIAILVSKHSHYSKSLINPENEILQFSGISPSQEQSHFSSGGVGQLLPTSLQREFESNLRFDFGEVRIHTDSNVDEFAKDIDALAFTQGTDIGFRRGEYNPLSDSGRKLIAHELVHVIQQDKGHTGVQRRVASDYNAIREHLSYGLFDWVITDEDARFVLNILNSLSPEDFESTIHQLRRDEILGRLLTNVAEIDKMAFAKVLKKIHDIETELSGFPECCKQVLKNIDTHIESAELLHSFLGASPFQRILGHNPAVQALHLIETDWEIWRKAVESVGPSARNAIIKEIQLHRIDHHQSKERFFWEKMESLFE